MAFAIAGVLIITPKINATRIALTKNLKTSPTMLTLLISSSSYCCFCFCSTVDIYIIPVLCKFVNFSFYFLQHFNNYSHFFYNLYIIFFILVESIIYLHIKKNHIISEWFPSQFRSALFLSYTIQLSRL